jgi:hypothetical protein
MKNNIIKQMPLPLFDSIEHFGEFKHNVSLGREYNLNDLSHATSFLNSYKGSQGTFNSYRREIERLLHWCTLVAKKSLNELKRNDIEAFIEFCQKPPKHWIGKSKPAKFIVKNGLRLPNPAWRPFVVTVSKTEHRKGLMPKIGKFELSHGSLRELFAILSSFYSYLLQECSDISGRFVT